MKKRLILAGLAATMLLSGCSIDLRFGGGSKTASSASATTTANNSTTNNNQHPVTGEQTTAPTIGQQLIDLKKAKDAGVMTDAEYEMEKAKLLNQK